MGLITYKTHKLVNHWELANIFSRLGAYGLLNAQQVLDAKLMGCV
jgi:hypothetical protein